MTDVLVQDKFKLKMEKNIPINVKIKGAKIKMCLAINNKQCKKNIFKIVQSKEMVQKLCQLPN